MYVSPDLEGFLSGEEGRSGSQLVAERQKRRCQPPLQQPAAIDQLGTTVFPGQTPSIGTGLGIAHSSIDLVSRLSMERSGQAMQFMTPWGVGCVRYRSPDGKVHQTGFAFTVDRIEPGRGEYLRYQVILLQCPLRSCTSATG